MLGFDLASVVALQRFHAEFEDFGKVGSGGFSTVSKVRNKRDQKFYALKTVKIKPSQFKGQVAEYLDKILGESRVLSKLRHPNILQYNGCWIGADMKTEADVSEEEEDPVQEDEELELVMEEYSQSSCGFQFQQASESMEKKKQPIKKGKKEVFQQKVSDTMFGNDLNSFKQIRMYLLSELGEYSLQKHIYLRNQETRRSQKQLQQQRIENYRIILQIVQGLMYVHSQNVIHRDIKLQNIILDKNLKCKIIDFGLAKKVRNMKSLTIEKFQHNSITNQDNEERHSSSVGTRIFSSPEQTNSDNYDHRTDIYSLAMVIGVIFSHYRTSHEENEIMLNLRNKKLDDFKIDISLKNLMSKCLSEQKFRPDLKQLKSCVKKLLKEELQSIDENTVLDQKLKYNFKQFKKQTRMPFDQLKEPEKALVGKTKKI